MPSVYVETCKIGDKEFFSFSRSHLDLSIYEFNRYSQLAILSRTSLINKIAKAAFNGMALAEEITSHDLIEINNYTKFSSRKEKPVVIGVVSSQPFKTEKGMKRLVAKVILLKKNVGQFWFEWWMETSYLDTLTYPTKNVRFSVVTVSVSAVDATKAPAMIKDMKKPLIDMQTKEWEEISLVLDKKAALVQFTALPQYEDNLEKKLKVIMPKELYQYYYHNGYDDYLRELLEAKKEGISRLRGTVDLPAL